MSALDSSRDSQLRQGTKARHSNQFTSQVKTSNGHNATHYARNKPGALPTGGRKSSNLSKSSQASNSTQRSSHAAKTTHDGLPRNPRGAAATLQSAPTKKELREAIYAQIARSHVIVIPTGMYANYSEWIQKEIDGSKIYKKPILAVEPWGQKRSSSVVGGAAKMIVGWNSESVVKGIWSLYRGI